MGMITVSSMLRDENIEKFLLIRKLDTAMIQQAREIFNRYHAQGVLLNDSFDDDIWIIYDERKRAHLRFQYSEVAYQKHMRCWSGCPSMDFKLSVKAYVLLRFGQSGPAKLRSIARELTALAVMDEEEVLKLTGEDLSHIISFLEVLPGDEEKLGSLAEELEDAAWRYSITQRGRKQRQLADFSSYLRFNSQLNLYWGQASEEYRTRFFPVYLWWKLTMVLPLRPGEFLLTPRNCIRATDTGYIITVRRSIIKGTGKVSYHLATDYEWCEYPIPQKLGEEILWYQQKTENYPKPDISLLLRHKSIPHNNKSGRVTYYNLIRLLKEYYREVLVGNSDITWINPGDTRHIAMMNLIISGGSPAVCCELAGHEDIDISSHYYTNFSTLIECAVYEEYRAHHSEKPVAVISEYSSLAPVEEGVRIGNGICLSRVKTYLCEQAYAVMDSSGFYITDAEALLKEWSHYYESPDMQSCYTLDSIPDFEKKCYQAFQDHGVQMCLTGFSGGVRYAPVVRYTKAHIWVARKNVADFLNLTGCKEVDSGANIVVYIADSDEVFTDCREINQSIVASPLQVFLDCMQLKGRGEEMAEAVYAKEIRK